MIDEKIHLLGDNFRGLWQVREIQAGRYNKSSFKVKWYVTFKYNGDFLETKPKDTREEALDYAIDFLGLK